MKRTLKWIAILFGLFILLVVIIGSLSGNSGTPSSSGKHGSSASNGTAGSSQSGSFSSASSSSSTPPPAPATWQTVATFSGDSTGNTSTFAVGGTWRAVWSSSDGSIGKGNFSVTIDQPGTSLPVGQFANVIGAGGSTSYEQGAGAYYLNVLADEKYSITIQTKVSQLPTQPTYSWHTVYQTNGDSIGNTPVFSAKAPWRVVWTSSDGSIGSGNFQVDVDTSGSTLPVDSFANVTGPDQGSAYEYTSGKYYLSVTADENYTLQVQEGQ